MKCSNCHPSLVRHSLTPPTTLNGVTSAGPCILSNYSLMNSYNALRCEIRWPEKHSSLTIINTVQKYIFKNSSNITVVNRTNLVRNTLKIFLRFFFFYLIKMRLYCWQMLKFFLQTKTTHYKFRDQYIFYLILYIS